ncbi:hypothetical protein CONPUDRAFT_75893 [Coniophora puteana RWD-64-598 SS2]|uniref:Uncharacterized protein n=1 Tax=Coniophora puteana (strain RWD-64-598) TaxID=741705 RepID=A0A5M3MDM2_CONPW|nr:uncharacterized protein CONPUDRAFT_75893 [Coniophora puteana RWD-64-598 SS2]EIW77086.1 hypothetical protein CONPUDRAFT_75893 [Coniophora puteana RWD-64-598 SS2]
MARGSGMLGEERENKRKEGQRIELSALSSRGGGLLAGILNGSLGSDFHSPLSYDGTGPRRGSTGVRPHQEYSEAASSALRIGHIHGPWGSLPPQEQPRTPLERIVSDFKYGLLDLAATLAKPSEDWLSFACFGLRVPKPARSIIGESNLAVTTVPGANWNKVISPNSLVVYKLILPAAGGVSSERGCGNSGGPGSKTSMFNLGKILGADATGSCAVTDDHALVDVTYYCLPNRGMGGCPSGIEGDGTVDGTGGPRTGYIWESLGVSLELRLREVVAWWLWARCSRGMPLQRDAVAHDRALVGQLGLLSLEVGPMWLPVGIDGEGLVIDSLERRLLEAVVGRFRVKGVDGDRAKVVSTLVLSDATFRVMGLDRPRDKGYRTSPAVLLTSAWFRRHL